MLLARQNRSGLHAEVLVAPPYARTTPVLTSSKMSTTPCSVASSRTRSRKPGSRRHDADVELDRLDDDRRDLAARGASRIAASDLRLVERRDDRLGDPRARDAGAGGHGLRRSIGPISSRGGWMLTQHVVVVAVVAALELDDLLAAGVAARDADGVHRRLGARVAEAHEIGAEALLDLLGQRDAVLDRERVAGAVRDAVLERLGQDRVRVAGGEDAEGHVEVDVLVAVRIADARAARIGHEQRVRVVGLERARDAERH